ncbi:MAG: HigA family addiction module antidote protein [Rhodospirillaceae bacterium]|nr:HigA family addiction module antidote protein [Rhodospirillaceae bacterium]
MMPVHPGRLLKGELAERGLSANQLALALRVPSGRITDILNGQRGISADTALRLSAFFGNSAEFWMTLQTQYELALERKKHGKKIAAEVGKAA